MKSAELRAGMAIEMNGGVWMTLLCEHVKPGKGPAYIQAKLKNLKTGSHMEKRLRSSEIVEQIDLDRREMEYLYSESSGAVFMDLETYDQTTINSSVLGNALDFLKANGQCKGLVLKGQVISVELPASVDLEITDTPPGIKDATKTNQLKEATLETGYKTRVPPFINIGEVVRVSTDTGEYLSRASS